MKDKIKSIKDFKSTVVVIRHADRDKIPAGEFGNDILLNEKGRSNSIEFGRTIQSIPIAKILTSPIQRCVQTAEYIIEGYGKELPIVQSTCLGDPGLHVADAAEAGAYYLSRGAFVMYEDFMKGDAVPGMPSIETFHNDFSNFLTEETEEDGLTLMITHDFLIAIADFVLHNRVYAPDNWVSYMDGFIVKSR